MRRGGRGRMLKSAREGWARDVVERACPSAGRGPPLPDHAWLAAAVGATAGASVCTVNRTR